MTTELKFVPANATEQQVLNIIKKIAVLNNCDEIIVESIIQQFCLLRLANIYGEYPKCKKCKIRKYCNYNKIGLNSVCKENLHIE